MCFFACDCLEQPYLGCAPHGTCQHLLRLCDGCVSPLHTQGRTFALTSDVAAIADLSGWVADWQFYTLALGLTTLAADLILVCGRDEEWLGWNACVTPSTWLGVALPYCTSRLLGAVRACLFRQCPPLRSDKPSFDGH